MSSEPAVGLTILLVDDNLDLAEDLSEILNDAGFMCTLAASGKHALVLLDGTRFDLVVTDLRIGAQDGLDVILAARARWPQLPVLLMTAYLSDANAGLARSAGVRDILRKPFSIPTFLDAVHEAV